MVQQQRVRALFIAKSNLFLKLHLHVTVVVLQCVSAPVAALHSSGACPRCRPPAAAASST